MSEKITIYDCKPNYDPNQWCYGHWEVDAELEDRDAIAEQWLAMYPARAFPFK